MTEACALVIAAGAAAVAGIPAEAVLCVGAALGLLVGLAVAPA